MRSVRSIAALVLAGALLAPGLPARAEGEPVPLPNIAAAVQRARAMIQEEIDREARDPAREPVVVTSRSVRLRVKLALWNEQDDSITLVRLTRGASGVAAVEHPSWRIRLVRDNGVNSEFAVVGHPELKVVALKHPVFVDIGTSKQPRWRLDNVVYTPYARYLAVPEIISAGEEFFDQQVAAAYAELTRLGAASRAFPRHLLGEAIDPLVVKSIIAIEHVSPAALLAGSVEQYLATFATVLGTNGRQAYAYARSSASARGLAQFIPSTYVQLVRTRPELKLNPNFELGMADPVNAIKAEVALLDSNLTLLPPEVRLRYETRPRDLGALLAAMYNGGSTRVRRAIQHWGEVWAQDHAADLAQLKRDEQRATAEVARLRKLLAQPGLAAAQRRAYEQARAEAAAQAQAAAAGYAAGTRAQLRRETVLYVAKFYLAYDHLTALAQAAAGAAEQPLVPAAVGGDGFTGAP